MRRCLLLCSLLLPSACKGDAPSKADEPAVTAPKADPAAPDVVPKTGADEAKAGAGLAGVIGETLSGAKASTATRLIPEGATVLVGLDIAPFVQSPLFESLKTRLGRRQREQLEAATRCGVGPDRWRTFVIGFDPTTRDMAMVTEATGLGTKATLQCLADQIGTFTLSEDGKTMSDHTGGGIVVNDDAIAFATPTWMGPLQDRIDGKGTPASEGPLAPVLARADRSAPLWFAGLIPVRQRAMAMGMLGSEPSDVAGSLRGSDVVELRLSVAVPDPETATAQLKPQWNVLQGLVISNGVPKSVVDSVKFGQADGAMTVQVSASNSDIELLLTKFLPG